MSRLTYSYGGFLRSMQMSSNKIFIFVEGGLDRAFMDRISARVCRPQDVGYRIYSSKELPGETGGKRVLVDFFEELSGGYHLACDAFDKKMYSLFLIDKDADDFSQRAIESPHVIYTKTYDLEGHLISCGEINRALSDAGDITIEQSNFLIPDPDALIVEFVKDWKYWIALCLISYANQIKCVCTFDKCSQINQGVFSGVDLDKLECHKNDLAERMGVEREVFDLQFGEVLAEVEDSISSGNPLRYFKGKWFHHLIQLYLESRPKIPDTNFNGIGEKILIAIKGQVDMLTSCRCSRYFEEPFEQALDFVA